MQVLSFYGYLLNNQYPDSGVFIFSSRILDSYWDDDFSETPLFRNLFENQIFLIPHHIQRTHWILNVKKKKPKTSSFTFLSEEKKRKAIFFLKIKQLKKPKINKRLFVLMQVKDLPRSTILTPWETSTTKLINC